MEIKQAIKVALTEEEQDTLIQAQAIFKEICYELNDRCTVCPLKQLCNECEMEPHLVVLNALEELNK